MEAMSDGKASLVAMGAGSAKIVSNRRASLQPQAPPES